MRFGVIPLQNHVLFSCWIMTIAIFCCPLLIFIASPSHQTITNTYLINYPDTCFCFFYIPALPPSLSTHFPTCHIYTFTPVFSESWNSLPEMWDFLDRECGSLTALVDPIHPTTDDPGAGNGKGTQLTYGEVRRDVENMAGALSRLGLNREVRVYICSFVCTDELEKRAQDYESCVGFDLCSKV